MQWNQWVSEGMGGVAETAAVERPERRGNSTLQERADRAAACRIGAVAAGYGADRRPFRPVRLVAYICPFLGHPALLKQKPRTRLRTRMRTRLRGFLKGKSGRLFALRFGLQWRRAEQRQPGPGAGRSTL